MKSVKIGIIVACLAAAVAITFLFGGEEAIPEAMEGTTHWKCTACDHEFELKDSQLFKEQERANSPSPLYCPKCSELKAYQPMACYTCNTLFFGPEVPGASGQCPKCRPDAVPPAEYETNNPEKPHAKSL